MTEKQINKQIIEIIKELIKNSEINIKKNTGIYALIHEEADFDKLIDLIQKESKLINEKISNLTIENVEDSLRRKQKYIQLSNLIIYLNKVKGYILTQNPKDAYQLILNDLIEKVDALKETTVGVQIGIKDDKLNHQLNIYGGKMTSDEKSKEIDKNTRFDVASVTKMFTALMVLKANEEKIIDIDSPISRNLNITPRELGNFSVFIQTDGRIDEDISKEELIRRLENIKLIEKDTFVYSDIPYILLGHIIPNNTQMFNILYKDVLKLFNTGYEIGNNTGGEYNKINEPHDPKARLLKKYKLYSGHAGIYTNSEDLLKLYDALKSDFWSSESLTTLVTNAYNKPIVYKDGKPVILNNQRYQNANRGFGVYLNHPYGIKHTDVPDIASKKAFAASGFTGCYSIYDLENEISANILTNPFSSKEKINKNSQISNELKTYQFYYIYALRLLDQAYQNSPLEKQKTIKRS